MIFLHKKTEGLDILRFFFDPARNPVSNTKGSNESRMVGSLSPNSNPYEPVNYKFVNNF